MENVTKQESNNAEQKETLEKRIRFWDRAKYLAIPAVATVGAYFGPELKRKYDNLSSEKKDTYRTIALASTTLFGTIVAISSGYNLFRGYASKKESAGNNINDVSTTAVEVT
jgi:hypothetical protein